MSLLAPNSVECSAEFYLAGLIGSEDVECPG